MSLGKKLCSIASGETPSNLAQKIWETMEESLQKFTEQTHEKGCSTVFVNVPSNIIEELQNIAKINDIEFCYWYQNSKGHPGVENQDIGIIAWDIGSFLQKYPFKVSMYVMIVTLKDSEKISVHIQSILDEDEK